MDKVLDMVGWLWVNYGQLIVAGGVAIVTRFFEMRKINKELKDAKEKLMNK